MDALVAAISSNIEISKEGVERITSIIHSMRNYSFKNVSGGFSLYDINKAVSEALVIAKSEYRKVATVETEFGDLPLIWCDPTEINQVLLNLIINSVHAIESQKRDALGKISINTWADSDNVFCSVEDDGPGIPQEIIDRIFEPFFTTKAIGKGTGLGLSLSYNIIINKHKGTLSVDSPPEGGTIITLSLPVTEPAEEDNIF
jgi:two-component system NtrC family sensor kinase